MGIEVGHIFGITFVLGCACLAVAACLLMPSFYVNPRVGNAFVLLAFPREASVIRIPAWVAILAISRDFLISLVALLAYERLDPSKFMPSWLGKTTTFQEILAISLALLFNYLGPRPWYRFLVPWVFYLIAVMVVASGVHYFFRATHTAEAA